MVFRSIKKVSMESSSDNCIEFPHVDDLDVSLYLKNICRFCLCKQDEAVNIFEMDSSRELVALMESMLKSNISKTDNLPQEMCLACRTTIEEILKFKSKCHRSEVILKKYIMCVLHNDSEITTDICESERLDLADTENSQLTVSQRTDLQIADQNNTGLVQETMTVVNNPKIGHKKQSQKNSRRQHVHRAYEILYGSATHAHQKCSECVFECKNIISLTKHRLKIHGAKKLQCLTCGNGFTTMRGLRIHLRIHSGEKREVCSICGKCFTDPRTRIKHESRHASQLPHACEECPRRFDSRASLAKHVQSLHPGPGIPTLTKYHCTVCANSYMHPHSLRVHMRKHTGSRPYSCHHCDRKFTNGTSLSAHIRSHNRFGMNRRTENTSSAVIHSCIKCSRNFKTAAALTSHMLTHTRIKNYMCEACGARVARNSELAVHKKTHQRRDTVAADIIADCRSPGSNDAQDLRVAAALNV